jgi:hypothetical protein
MADIGVPNGYLGEFFRHGRKGYWGTFPLFLLTALPLIEWVDRLARLASDSRSGI